MSNKPVITTELLDRLKSTRGGYTRAALETLGVGWPPKRGWRKELIRQARANEAIRQTQAPAVTASHWEVIKVRFMVMTPAERVNVMGQLSEMYCQHCGRGKSVGVYCPCTIGP